MGRDLQLVCRGKAPDAHRLAVAIGAAYVGHQEGRGVALDDVAELPTGEVVFARRNGYFYFFRNVFKSGEIVREHRLFIPEEVELLEERRLANVAEHIQALV